MVKPGHKADAKILCLAWDELIESTGDISTKGDLTVGQSIFHDGDTDTKMVFTAKRFWQGPELIEYCWLPMRFT